MSRDMSREFEENPRGLTKKGERMYEHVKAAYAGDPRAKEIAARTVYARAAGGTRGLRKNREGEVEYYETYDGARHAALQRPGLHCFAAPGAEWTQCFMHLQHGQCLELAMTEDGRVEEGVTWTLEDGELRANPGEPDEDDEDDWDEPTPVEAMPIPPMSAWPTRDADSAEWQEFMRRYPRVPHSPGGRRRKSG